MQRAKNTPFLSFFDDKNPRWLIADMDSLGRFILGKNLFLAKSFFEVLVIKEKICLSK